MSETRKFENLHILLWLLKDVSWLMTWKTFGIFMIFPTVGFAILISYKSRNSLSEFLPNLAIVFWISANSFWMMTEFFTIDEKFKIFALLPFILGFICIASYYITNFRDNRIGQKSGI